MFGARPPPAPPTAGRRGGGGGGRDAGFQDRSDDEATTTRPARTTGGWADEEPAERTQGGAGWVDEHGDVEAMRGSDEPQGFDAYSESPARSAMTTIQQTTTPHSTGGRRRRGHDAADAEGGVSDIPEIPTLGDDDDADGYNRNKSDPIDAPEYDAEVHIRNIDELNKATFVLAGKRDVGDRFRDDRYTSGDDRYRDRYGDGDDEQENYSNNVPIDVSLLAQVLVPRQFLDDDDSEWRPDGIWNELKSELRADEERRAFASRDTTAEDEGQFQQEQQGLYHQNDNKNVFDDTPGIGGTLRVSDFASPTKNNSGEEKKRKSLLGRMKKKFNKLTTR